MGVAYYLVLKRVDGKLLAKASDRLTNIAEQLNVNSLETFLGGLTDVDDVDFEVEETWLSPDKGLVRVNALLDFLQTQPNAVSEQEGVIEDLQNLKEVLEFA